jgi:hypothetical protein
MAVEIKVCEAFLVHLIDAGVIDEAQAVAALDRQRSQGKPIGRMALGERILTMQQVFEILEHQSTAGGLFGEIAIAKGFMCEAQLVHLLQLQKELRPSIGHVLVELGCLSEVQLAEQRRAYLDQVETILA